MKKLFVLLSLLLCPSLLAIEIQDADAPNRVPNRYIVKMKDIGERSALRVLSVSGASVLHTYPAVLPRSVAIHADEQTIAQLQNDPRVESIKADKMYYISAAQSTQANGLDRIDSQTGRDGVYNFSRTGAGVHAYVIDTGLRSTHREFSGRVGPGFDSVKDGFGTNDCNGHGSHVAGTIGGTTFGVAKSVIIHPVRVLDCNGGGTLSDVIAGVEFVGNNAIKPAVANMSLGGGIDSDLDAAVAEAIAKGVLFVLAAGNESQNACNVSPARVANAVTVAATQSNSDRRVFFSNFGACVDLFAPGDSILSVGIVSDSDTEVLDGTSMASPHVAGALALILQDNPDLTPSALSAILLAQSTKNVVTDLRGSPNRFLFTNP